MRREIQQGEYNWSSHEGVRDPVRKAKQFVSIDDESLRDGLQGTQLTTHPSLNEKEIYLASVALNGYIEHADIGFPGSEESHKEELSEIIKFVIASNGLDGLTLSCAAGAIDEHINPIIDLSHQFDGYPLEADIFLDVSKNRAEIEGWDRKEKISVLKQNIKLLKSQQLPVMFVPERSTSTPPEELLEVCLMASELGVDRICFADTKGVADNKGIENIFRWGFEEIGKANPNLKWDAHFHNDRNMALSNSLVAAAEGVDRLHATMFCIGERAGNVDLAQLLVNLNLQEMRNDDLTSLKAISELSSKILGFEIPKNSPIYGENAFATSSGIHASAGKKELQANRIHSIYFPFSPESVGNKAIVEVGPFSGKSNVELKLRQLGISSTPALIDVVLSRAKQQRGLLSDEEVRQIAASE